MIGQNLKDNQEKQPNSREMEKLKKDFPQFFSKDGEFKLDMFKDFLREEEIDISKEGYELKFLGKSYAKYISSLETETYISPDSNHNAKDENKDSENLYIVGDNIDALKHLLGSYAGKIKCIYIDPPYNTGADGFVYPDNFQFNKEDLSEKIGITEEEAKRILELAGKSTHSAWMTFMYPRLLLARDLLSDDGVIFISIDDNEEMNLRLMCDEIFGEENFLNIFPRVTKKGGKSSNAIANNNDYILSYTKNFLMQNLKGIEHTDKQYKYKDKYFNERGYYKLNQALDYDSLQYSKSLDYPIEYDGYIFYPGGSKELYEERKLGRHGRADWAWRWSKDLFDFGLKNDFIVFTEGKKNNRKRIYTKTYEKVKIISKNDGYEIININRTKPMSTLELTKNEFSNDNASSELSTLSENLYFDYPKPTSLIKLLFNRIDDGSSFYLDFFSGSSTTADAVMQLNAEDGGSRKYIMVQLPEKIEENKPAYKAGYRSIDEIGRARIEKAATKVKEETCTDIDYGYKLYYLEKPSEKTLMDLENFVPENKLTTDDMVSVFDNKHSKGKESILATWINEDGYGLSKSSKAYKLESYEADLIEKTLYIIDKDFKKEDSMELIRRIENEELDITRLVIYVHSVTFSVLHELRKNLKVLRNNKNVTLIERF